MVFFCETGLVRGGVNFLMTKDVRNLMIVLRQKCLHLYKR